MTRISPRLLGALTGAMIAAACSTYDSTIPDIIDGVSAEDRALESSAGISTVRQGNGEIVRVTGKVTAGVDQFRTLLGTLNPNTAGQKVGGRREINWDGVPAAVTNVDNFPGDFFNATSPRGALYTTTGTGFRVSDNGFVDVNPSYAGAFNAFSGKKTFEAVGSAVTDVKFVVAGSATPAAVTGFGVVFVGANRSRTAAIEFYNAAGQLLLSVSAPRATDSTGQSFAGAVFDAAIVARVRIVSGQAPLSATRADGGANGSGVDLVVMDDFIYGEPQQIP